MISERLNYLSHPYLVVFDEVPNEVGRQDCTLKMRRELNCCTDCS